MRIIPAIDLIDGKCVRLTKGDYSTQKVYNEDPVAMAREFEDHGVQYLHLVDLDGAKAGHPINLDVLEAISNSTSMLVDYGGGLRTIADVNSALNAGASQVNLGSVAVKHPDEVAQWIKRFGNETIILSADVKGMFISIGGWLDDNGPHIDDFMATWEQHDADYVCSTAISQDGTLEGPDFKLYKHLVDNFPSMQVIASGGVSDTADVLKLLEIGVEGCIIGKAIYEDRITMNELEKLILLCSNDV